MSLQATFDEIVTSLRTNNEQWFELSKLNRSEIAALKSTVTEMRAALSECLDLLTYPGQSDSEIHFKYGDCGLRNIRDAQRCLAD